MKFNMRAILYLVLLLLSSSYAQAVDLQDQHLLLRNETANHYMSPEPHLKLARHYYDMGDKVQAFYISEHTRSSFGDEKFTPAFLKVAAIELVEPPEFKDEDEAEAYCKAHPDSVYAQLMDMDLASRDPEAISNAVQQLNTLLSQHPQDVFPKTVAAKYFLKAVKDYDRALVLYIDLYFYNPHYYDWEYAEFRIKEMTSSLKESWWSERKKSGRPIGELLIDEKNPRVLDPALEEIREHWNVAYVPSLIALLSNDDHSVQTRSLHLLMDHPQDVPADDIHALLKSPDLVKRAMASFLVVTCFKPADYTLLQDNLDSASELILMDTIQALAGFGGTAGIAFLKDHPPAHASDWLIDYWKKACNPPPPSQPDESEAESEL